MKQIQLTQDKVTIVDDNLYDWLNQWKWYYKGGYACRNEYEPTQHTVRMHVVINQTPSNFVTDHINGDKLDNRCSNLRSANKAQNGHNQGMHKNNTSGHKDIYWHKRDEAYRVQLRIEGKKKYIGNYKTIEEAIIARDTAIQKYHGEFGNIT